MGATLFRHRKKGVLGTLKESDLSDVVIALIGYNKVNPRKRWSELAEKIMAILNMTLVYENGEEILYFEDEDKEFR